MTTMVERVARALARQKHQNGSFRDEAELDRFIDFVWEYSQPAARAVLDAMREPTEEIVMAGLNSDAWSEGDDGAVAMLTGTYRAMIDAALNERKADEQN